MEQIVLAATGFASGFLVAGGVVALMTGLGILTRFIGISRTAGHAALYEDFILAGAVAGTLLTVYEPALPAGIAASAILAIAGLFMGVFVGGWIMALAEVVHIFPVYCRRLGITKGRSLVVIFLALGKTAGSLLHFFMRWGL